MQEMDRIAIEGFGIPGVVLMKNAGRGVVDAFIAHFPPPSGRKGPDSLRQWEQRRRRPFP
jgi:NAD(P)H-hydrate repair Nnr-like enzyme with NAD(P)H-hydrate epimerase domain